MRTITEGVPLDRMNHPLLHRNMPPMLETAEEYERVYNPMKLDENLILKIHPTTYHIEYHVGTEEWHVHDENFRGKGMSGMIDIQAERKMGFAAKFGPEGSFVMNKFGAEGVAEMEREWQETFGEKKDRGEQIAEGNGEVRDVEGQTDGADDAVMTGL